MVEYFKYVWISVFSTLMFVSATLIFHTPGFQLPTSNPVPILRPSHLLEWFDFHSVKEIPYLRYGIGKWRSSGLFLLWGFQETQGASVFDPASLGILQKDETFKIGNLDDFRSFNELCREIKKDLFESRDDKDAKSTVISCKRLIPHEIEKVKTSRVFLLNKPYSTKIS